MDVSTLCLGCLEPRRTAPVCDQCGWDDRAAPQLPLALPPGTRLNDQFLLGRVLGHGGFGITYLARDVTLNVKVAIKEYLPGQAATRSSDRITVTPFTAQRETFDWGLDSFLDEARALARFHDHPNIVTVLSFFRANGTGYLVMTYVPGRTLEAFLETRAGVLPFRTAARVMLPVMDALRAAHGMNLLHRDVSPDNIYLTTSGHVKLMDFGAARIAYGERSQNLSVMLKPGYAPWEQYSSRGQQGPWTDVYAVAATLYRAVTGRTPPQAPDRRDRDELVPPSRLGIEMPPHAEAALMKGLAVLAADRYASIDEFQAPILAALELGTPGKQAAPVPRPVPIPGPIPGPDPRPVPTLNRALERVVQRLDRGARLLEAQIARIHPRLHPPADVHPTMRLVTAVAAGLVGLLGAASTIVELLGLSPGAQIFGAFFPGLVPLAKLSLLLMLAVHATLLAGGLLCLLLDGRGPRLVWAGAWSLAVLAVASLAWFLLLTPMTATWTVLAEATRGAMQSQVLGGTIWVLLQAAAIVGLVLKLDGPRGGSVVAP